VNPEFHSTPPVTESDTQPTAPLNDAPLLSPYPPSSSRFNWRVLLPLSFAVGIGVILMMTVIGTVIVMFSRETSVTVIIDGERQKISTDADTIADLMDEMNLVVGRGDFVSPPPETKIEANLTVRIDGARRVLLTIDGDTQTLLTTATSPWDILEETELEVNENDLLMIDGTETTIANLLTWPVPANHITIKHAVELHIEDGDTTRTVYTTQDTVGDALFDAGLQLYLADDVSVDLNAPVVDGLTISIDRSTPTSLIVDGEIIETRSDGPKVIDALTDAGVVLNGLDYTIPFEDTPLQPGMRIRVIRVREEVITEQEALPFETVFEGDASLELDQRRLRQEGQNGIRQTYVRIRYENDAEISRHVEESVIVQEPVNRIVAYGTNIVLRTIDTPEGPRQYWRHIRMYATSYHPAALGGDNVTATGELLRHGIVAVVPGVIPFYTNVYVPNYGIGMVADSGGGLPNSRLWIDLGYEDHDYVHWSEFVDVYLLTPVPDNIRYILPE